MTVPCCYPNLSGQEPPWLCVQTDTAEDCRSFHHQARPGPLGAECSDSGGCYDCNRPPSPPVPDTGGCCYPDQQWLPVDLQNNPQAIHNCTACGGTWYANIDDCVPVYPEPECHAPREDRAPPTGRRWTIDLVDQVAFGIDPELGDGGVVRPMTCHLTRAIGPMPTETEPCAHFRSRKVMLADGAIYTEVCSEPVWNDPASRRVAYAGMMTVEGMDRDEFEDGAQYDVALVHLPYYDEAIVRSHQYRCGGWEE